MAGVARIGDEIGGRAAYVGMMLTNILSVMLMIAMLAVLGVLITGVFAFSRGGEFNAKHSNRLMNLRVATQAVAVAILGLLVLVRALGG